MPKERAAREQVKEIITDNSIGKEERKETKEKEAKEPSKVTASRVATEVMATRGIAGTVTRWDTSSGSVGSQKGRKEQEKAKDARTAFGASKETNGTRIGARRRKRRNQRKRKRLEA